MNSDGPPATDQAVAEPYRSGLTVGEDVVNPRTWAGSVPATRGIAPRVRIGRARWFNLPWLIPIGLVLLIGAVGAAKGLRTVPSVQRFIARNPGVSDSGAVPPVGLPIWVGVQHFFNLFLLIFIIRSGIQIFTDHPRLYWTRHSTPGKDWFRAQRPVPADPLWTAKQDSISLPGQVGLPGLRHSIGLARWWHLGCNVVWLVNGVVFYVLVFSTGHWRRIVPTGWDVFGNAGSVLVIVGWVAATPFTLKHPRVVQRVGYALVGPAQRLFEHIDSSPGEYTAADISPYFWHNGKYPDCAEYRALRDGHFADYRLRVGGLVAHSGSFALAELRAMPHHEQITQHFCIQGWSGVAKWGGVSMQTILDLVRSTPEAKWVVFYALGDGPDAGVYYDAHPIEQMTYQLTMLAYDVNDEPLSFGHGAPLRLRNETQLGFKQVKWLEGIEFVADFADIGGGYGGYNQDHEFFGYRQSI